MTEWTKAIIIQEKAAPGMKAIQVFKTGEILLINRHTNSRMVDPKYGIHEFELSKKEIYKKEEDLND